MPGNNILGRTWPNDYNIMQHSQMLHEKFDHFKLVPTTPNMLEHVATEWSNVRNMLRATKLRYVALKCSDS